MSTVEELRRAADRTLTGLEPLIEGAADTALTELAALIAAELARPDPLEATASIGGVLSRIRRWWNRLVDQVLLAPILAVYETAAAAAARRFDTPPPPQLQDLPARHLEGEDVPELVDQYLRQARSRLARVGDTLWDAARNALADAEAEGETLDELTARLREVFADHGHQLGEARARRIARTETVAAWNRAQLDTARTLTGPHRPATKTWLCVAPWTRVSGRGLTHVARRSYSGPLVRIGLASGRLLAVTGDHPVLTGRGWVPAKGLQVGDHLIGGALADAPGVEGPGAAGPGRFLGGAEPDVKDVPPRIDEVFRAAAQVSPARRVMGAVVDLDGEVPDREVEVVTLNGGLRADVEAAAAQHFPESFFELTDMRLGSLLSAGAFDDGFLTHCPAGEGLTRFGGPGSLGLLGLGGGGDGAGLFQCPDLHARLGEPCAYGVLADPQIGGERVDRAAALVGGGQGLGVEVEAPRLDAEFLGGAGLLDPAGVSAEGQAAGFTGRADRHARLPEPPQDRLSGDADASGDGSGALPGLIRLDYVTDIDVSPYVGHVYDLSTESGWFLAEGLIIHNSTLDTRTRPSHFRADGQTVALAESFTIGGWPMAFPGDPSAPPEETIQCRCTLTFDDDIGGDAGRQFLTDEQIAEVIRHYEEQGIVRTTDRQASAAPTAHATAAGDGEYTGAMIALVPSADTIGRLTLPDGEPPEQLHATLYYLGDAADFTEADRDRLTRLVAAYTANLAPVEADAFAASAYNPHRGDTDTALVLGLSGAQLEAARDAALAAVDEYAGTLPDQHCPWVPHVTLAYSTDLTRLADVADRAGPVVFDAVRVVFAGDVTDLPLTPGHTASATSEATQPRRWSTPDDTALAFEGSETGDGRVFAPGALYWQDGPWPLQYAEQMLGGHDGARLAGTIDHIDRVGDRITGTGVLYPDTPAGAESICLLERGAPLGVSVDLDDVDVEIIDRRPPEERDGGGGDGGEVVLLASLDHARFLRLPDGGWAVRGTQRVEWATDTDGAVSAAGLADALTAAGLRGLPAKVSAAAGDRDDPDEGELLMTERAGDYLMRVTRGRVRGATLVAMPAYHQARIVLDAPTDGPIDGPIDGPVDGRTAAAAAATDGEDCDCKPRIGMDDVVVYVAASPVPVTAADVAAALGITTARARGFLVRAAAAGRITRVARGRYIAAATLPETITAAAAGDLGLPIHPDRDAPWDGPKAASRVLAWATGDDGTVDAKQLGRAFLYRDPSRDPATLAAYKLGFADVRDDQLTIIPRAVFTVANVLQGGRGGVNIPAEDQDRIRRQIERLYERLGEEFDDPDLHAPWLTPGNSAGNRNDDAPDDNAPDDDQEEEGMRELVASAWTAMRDMPPMPAAWFRAPTQAELPPGSGGVHYTSGRIYGWVAQAGEPHAGMPGRKVTIESLGDIDLTHFLRAKFKLDDGSEVRAGAFTMNVGHHRDGAECETAACQFDDTRTVAGIVTVGINDRGMWFSGAAAPWLSEWDRQVFAACQPSYHMRQGSDGRWQLRAVLSVPVPGHSSPLVASAVAERANLALAASAAATPPTPGPGPGSGEPDDAPAGGPLSGVDVQALAAALAPAVAEELQRQERIREEVAALAATLDPVRAELARGMAQRLRQTN